MSDQNDIRKLIKENERRLQKRREQKASLGISADPSIDIEIEDIQAEIKKLEKELIEAGGQAQPSPTVSSENRKENTQLAKKNFGDYLRDPLWQGISALIAIIALGWAVYTFYMGGEVSGQVSPTQTSAAGVIASIPTSTDTLTPTQTPTATSTTPTSVVAAQSTADRLPTRTPTATPTLGEIASAPTDTPTVVAIAATIEAALTSPDTPTPMRLTPTVSTSSCPQWFATPEPGKAVVILGNHYYREVQASYFYNAHQNPEDGSWVSEESDGLLIPAKQQDTPGREVFQVSPGFLNLLISSLSGVKPSFRFFVWENRNESEFEFQSGQILGYPLFDFSEAGVEQPVPYPLEIPEGCP